ncbi:unnamed protein product, partial [Heterosigma akashiwo]
PLQALYLDLWTGLVALAFSLCMGMVNLTRGFEACASNEPLQRYILGMCLCSALCHMIEQFGMWHFDSVVVSVMSSGCKLASTLVSVAMFGYPVTLYQFASAILIFVGITGELFLGELVLHSKSKRQARLESSQRRESRMGELNPSLKGRTDSFIPSHDYLLHSKSKGNPPLGASADQASAAPGEPSLRTEWDPHEGPGRLSSPPPPTFPPQV